MKVLLGVNDQPMVDCSLKYIGMLGMHINSRAILPDYGKSVVVLMSTCSKLGTFHCNLPAVVTEKSPASIGLTFCFQDLKSINLLKKILECYLLEHLAVDI